MVKLVVFSVLVMVAAMSSQTKAFGVVRIDVQKDNNGAQLANAIGNAISSKIQSWNNILNSLFQVKYGSVGTGSVSSTSTSTSTSTANVAPLYQKLVTVNSGYAPAAPSSSRVVASAPSPKYTAGQTILTVNKSFGVIPAVSVASSPVVSSPVAVTSVASGSAPTESTASNTIGYSYRKRFV